MDKKLISEYLESMEKLRKVIFYAKFPCDIPKSELAMLEAIYTLANDGIKPTTSSLSELLMITKPAVSQSINSLEKKGWVIRDIDENDKRVYCIRLTDGGLEQVALFEKKITFTIGYILNQLGEEDTRKFIDISKKCHDIMVKFIESGGSLF